MLQAITSDGHAVQWPPRFGPRVIQGQQVIEQLRTTRAGIRTALCALDHGLIVARTPRSAEPFSQPPVITVAGWWRPAGVG